MAYTPILYIIVKLFKLDAGTVKRLEAQLQSSQRLSPPWKTSKGKLKKAAFDLFESASKMNAEDSDTLRRKKAKADESNLKCGNS